MSTYILEPREIGLDEYVPRDEEGLHLLDDKAMLRSHILHHLLHRHALIERPEERPVFVPLGLWYSRGITGNAILELELGKERSGACLHGWATVK